MRSLSSSGIVVPTQNTVDPNRGRGAQAQANVATVDPGDTGTGFPPRYGAHNADGIYTSVLRFLSNTFAFRKSAANYNAGKAFAIPQVRRNGVLPGNAGLMRTFGYLDKGVRFQGVLYAFTPVKEVPQTSLAQWAATPLGYTGDTPGDLQQQIQNAPPWRRAIARGDSRQSFRSGIMRGARL